ncbi:MAG: Nif3-like dinuclear metal center hexameric protein [Cytophagales bacterium]|nr:MAG: Nif3-like dinuclear metal center hexameric protein [Cytophagales bacterium]
MNTPISIAQVIKVLETLAPPSHQEDYDNAGLIVGNPQQALTGVLIALDSLESVVEEAIACKANLIVAHHPIVFRGLKKLNGKNYIERTLLKAITHQIALYAIHTNLDNISKGVNLKICQKLGLQNCQILQPKSQTLMKLTTFVPTTHTQTLLTALGNAGAGQIGNYQNCSFRVQGVGTFQPNDQATPFIGQANQYEEVTEDRIEVLFEQHQQHQILKTLRQAHPYEEVAYYLHRLENENQEVGAGMIGELTEALPEKDFLAYLKAKMNLKVIRHTQPTGQPIKRVAVCGGAGSFLLGKAQQKGAQAFVSADFKYHEFFDAENKLIIADIGHYESEIYTCELLKDTLFSHFPTLPLQITQTNTNPIDYYF